MLLKDIPYFVKFVFLCDEDVNGCYSFTSRETLKFVKHKHTDKAISSLKVGDEIYFESKTLNKFKSYSVSEILIQQIVDDLKSHQYGIDPDDCKVQGEHKEWLFKILVKLRLLD